MSELITSAQPRFIPLGIRNLGSRRIPVEPYNLPDHCPLVMDFAKKGGTRAILVSGNNAVVTYGEESFDVKSKWATHQTVLVKEVFSRNANSFFFQRLKAPDALPESTLAIWADVLETNIPQWTRDSNGDFLRDADGNRVPVMVGGVQATEPGVSLYFFKAPCPRVNADGDVITQDMIDDFGPNAPETFPVANQIGMSAQRIGTRSNGSATSIQFPIADFEVSSFGGWGDDQGFRLFCPTTKNREPVNASVVRNTGSQLFRMQMVERSEQTNTPIVTETLNGSRYLEFSFKPNVFDAGVSRELFFDLIFPQTWSDTTSVGFVPVQGPFSRFHIYRDNMETIMQMMYNAEIAVNPNFNGGTPWSAGVEYIMNWAGAVTEEGIPYYATEIATGVSGSINLNETAVHYAVGGSDGTMTNDVYDALVNEQLEYFGELENKYDSWARYPMSVMYDSGYKIDTKKKFFKVMGMRKNMWVVVSTQDISRPPNTISEDSSMGVALSTEAGLYPESEYYGTSAVRAVIVPQVGKILNSSWTGWYPLTFQIAEMYSRYMGAGSGVWRNVASPTVAPNNQVTRMRDVTNTYKPARTREYDWASNMMWAEDFDHLGRVFYAAQQTVFPDDTAPINSVPNMIICCVLEMISFRSWQLLTGRDDLTPAQFAEESNALIRKAVIDKFDGRAIVFPRTYFTEADTASGYRWHVDIDLYTNTMQSVGQYTINSDRMSALSETV